MTLDEAIKELESVPVDMCDPESLRRKNATYLGIEALKREKEYRLTRGNRTFDLLPGETKE